MGKIVNTMFYIKIIYITKLSSLNLKVVYVLFQFQGINNNKVLAYRKQQQTEKKLELAYLFGKQQKEIVNSYFRSSSKKVILMRQLTFLFVYQND